MGSTQAEESRQPSGGPGGGASGPGSSGAQNREASTIHAREQKGIHGLLIQVRWLPELTLILKRHLKIFSLFVLSLKANKFLTNLMNW